MALLVVPSLSLHGTGSTELSQSALSARDGVRKLANAVDAASPNPRDYYPAGDAAFPAALEAHNACLAAVTGLADDLLHLAESSEQPFVARAQSVPDAPPALPVIHLNGSGVEYLRDTARDAFRAAQAAEEALRQVVPNARDYATNAEWVAAREQHADRVAVVRRVAGYFLSVAMACKKTA